MRRQNRRYAPVAQWIEQSVSTRSVGVRVLPGALGPRGCGCEPSVSAAAYEFGGSWSPFAVISVHLLPS